MKQEKLNGGTVMMALARGTESKDAVVFPKYIGVGVFNVIGLNPDAAEFEKIYGRAVDKEPEYTSEDEKGVKQVRLDFIIKTVPDKNNGIEFITKQGFFLKDAKMFTKDGLKVKVINAYGECAWVGLNDVAAQTVPATMSWFKGPYREVVVGEEELTGFLKTYLNIPNKSYYNTKTEQTIYIDNIADAEARLDGIANYFSGNVKEIKEVLKYQPDNKVKLAVGIKTTDDGKQYQDIFTKMPVRNSVTNYSKLDAAIQEAKANGAYAKTEFSIEPLHEYVVDATGFSNAPVGQAPAPAANVPPADINSFFGAAPAVVVAPGNTDMPY